MNTLFLTLVVSYIRESIAVDPCCVTGTIGTWNEQWICCPKSCRTCAECPNGSLQPQPHCCTHLILLNGIDCKHNDPPCIITECELGPLDHSFQPKTSNDGYLQIDVTACDEWEYGSSSNSLQIQLKGEYNTSPFFFVNECGSLPTNGQTQRFDTNIDYMNEIGGTLFSIVLSMNDLYGYCIKKMSIAHYEFAYDYFGMGLLLSSRCKYNYISLSAHTALIRCIDDYLELYTYKRRGIYKVILHSCVHNESGISAMEMKNNVYGVIMGKRHHQNVYDTTDIMYIDHYTVGDIHLDELGHLIATNILLSAHSSMSDALYSRNVEGKIIGIKLECADYDMRDNYRFESICNDMKIKIDGINKDIYSCSALQNGKYLVGFLRNAERVYVNESTEIKIYGDMTHHIYAHVYIIFDGFTKQYQLPFIMQDIGDYDSDNYRRRLRKQPFSNRYKYSNNNDDVTQVTAAINDVYDVESVGINWFDANTECGDKYGTSLTSIHSKTENILINGFLGDDNAAWIGFINFDINKINNRNEYTHNWKWIDGSYADYINWKMDDPQHKDAYDCAFIDKKEDMHGWSNTHCEERNKIIKYICASPYWYRNNKRNFELNVEDHIDEITLISIGNNHSQDKLCLDSVSVDNKVPIDITNQWIGGETHDDTLRAIFKAPVCKTEVIEMDILYDTAVSGQGIEDRSIPNLFCSNQNRVGAIGCSIDQGFLTTDKTTFRILDDGKQSHYMASLSWASQSKITLSTQQTVSITTNNEFAFDKKYFIYHAINKPNGMYEITNLSPAHVRPDDTFYDIYEHSDHSHEYIQSYESTSGLQVISCGGFATVPPKHIQSYELFGNTKFTTVNAKTELRLTLCPEFLNTAQDNQDTNFVYLHNVLSQLSHWEIVGCATKWAAPQYIPNDISITSCADEQELAITEDDVHIARCNSKNPDLYDGCQCTRDRDICWCSDIHGNKIKGKVIEAYDLPESAAWQEMCVTYLNCSNTEVIIPS